MPRASKANFHRARGRGSGEERGVGRPRGDRTPNVPRAARSRSFTGSVSTSAAKRKVVWNRTSSVIGLAPPNTRSHDPIRFRRNRSRHDTWPAKANPRREGDRATQCLHVIDGGMKVGDIDREGTRRREPIRRQEPRCPDRCCDWQRIRCTPTALVFLVPRTGIPCSPQKIPCSTKQIPCSVA